MNIEFKMTPKYIEDLGIPEEFQHLSFIVEYTDAGGWSGDDYIPEILIKSVTWSDGERCDDLAGYFIDKVETATRAVARKACTWASDDIRECIYKILEGESYDKATIRTAFLAAKTEDGGNCNRRAINALMSRNGIGGGDPSFHKLLDTLTAEQDA